MNDRSMAEAIKKLRKENAWSMEALARKVGVSLQTVYRWEKGVAPQPLAIQKLESLGLKR